MFPPNDSDAPPPYPGPSPFSLISYEETTAVDDAADSLRLPSYQPHREIPYLVMRSPAANILAAPPANHVQNTELGFEEQHRRRVLRLFHLIPEFERAVRQALAAAQHRKCCADTKTSTDINKPAMD
ncbi:hypothetical protein C0995_014141 [Termitomyces sp. Mi166|nr:hypothetical protein C0995_014141 [Termitomyces sp. Mi166\